MEKEYSFFHKVKLSEVCFRSEAIWTELVDRAEELRIEFRKLRCGAVMMDAGLSADGTIEAGRLLTALSTGGLADVSVVMTRMGEIALPALEVKTCYPAAACLDFQMGVETVGAILSGPIRPLIEGCRYVEEDVPKGDQAALRIVIVEPYYASEDALEQLAVTISGQAGIPAGMLRMVVAPRDCIAGMTQICGRGIENMILTIWKSLKKDPRRASEVMGKTPLIPILRVNDGRLRLDPDDFLHYLCEGYVTWNPEEGEDVADLCRNLCFESIPEYGVYFDDLLKKYDYDFYKIPHVADVNRVANMTVHDLKEGRIHHAGRQRIDLIEARL